MKCYTVKIYKMSQRKVKSAIHGMLKSNCLSRYSNGFKCQLREMIIQQRKEITTYLFITT